MSTAPLHRRLTPAQYAVVQDAARERAVQLRNEAVADAWTWLARQCRRGLAALAVRRPQTLARTGAPAR